MVKAKKSRKRTTRKVPAVRVRRAAPAAKKAAKKKAAPKKTPKTTPYKTATSMTAPPTPSVLSFGAGLEAIVKNSSLLSERVAELTNEVSFSVATKTAGGKQIQHQMGLLTAGNLQEYNPLPDAQEDAIDKLVSEGCRLVRRGRFAVTMCGPASVVEKLIGGKLVVQARARRSPLRATQMFATSFEPPLAHDHFVSPAASLSVGTAASDNVDHLVFIPPPVYFAPPSPNAPPGSYHRVDEASIRSILNVPAGFDGDGVRVAMVDTGFFPHPYYSQRGLKFRAVPTASAPNPQVDNYGHGTAIAYNVFATAPKAELLGFQQTDPPQDALEDAADANVDVITCSWGWDREQLFPLVQASLLSIINEGKIVLFASGNGQYAWPGSEPDVISVGGVYWNPAHTLEASDYASGFMIGMFPGRRTPDVCGLCGHRFMFF
jgi:serine protease AprX